MSADTRKGVEGYEWVNLAEGAGWPRIGELWHCPRCGTTRLEVLHSDEYETSIRCPDCKIWSIVHDG